MRKGCWTILCGKYNIIGSCYWSEQLVAGIQMPDELPTDQEHRFGVRADQAYNVQLTVESISFGCLTFGGLTVNSYFCLIGCPLVKLNSKEFLYSCYMIRFLYRIFVVETKHERQTTTSKPDNYIEKLHIFAVIYCIGRISLAQNANVEQMLLSK